MEFMLAWILCFDAKIPFWCKYMSVHDGKQNRNKALVENGEPHANSRCECFRQSPSNLGQTQEKGRNRKAIGAWAVDDHPTSYNFWHS